MKRDFIKRILAVLLVLTMVLCIAACGTDSSSGSSLNNNNPTVNKNDPTEPSNNEPEDPDVTEDDGTNMTQATELSGSKLRYVMIYNPKIYDENSYFQSSSLTVGAFGRQIDVETNRADGMQTEPEFTSVSQQDWNQYLSDNINLEDNRADVMGTDYDEGDTQYFYYSPDGDLQNREYDQFTCQYAGEYCYIWTVDSVSQSIIDDLGEEFDDEIYEPVSSTFGTPRFVGTTGKVNILLYNMSGGLLGYFARPDLFVESELSFVGLENMDCNTGHAIINVNARYLSSYRDMVYSTMAHELQHLINFSSFFNTTNAVWMNTWCDEAMSGYIEEELYPGSMEEEGRIQSYNESGLIRNGQSLYNFKTTSYDIGVYGSVYYFSQYLEEIAGDDVFTDMMDYWRDSYSDTLCTAEALSNSVSKKVYNKIDQSIDYAPLKLRFASDEEEWMSKLCLNFYLSSLSNEDDISAFDDIDQRALLYDSMDGAEIEGGGRIIIALSDDTFEIPEDSDDGLIYIGLDKNFKPITGFVYQ